jgi:hypothetical protein
MIKVSRLFHPAKDARNRTLGNHAPFKRSIQTSWNNVSTYILISRKPEKKTSFADT